MARFSSGQMVLLDVDHEQDATQAGPSSSTQQSRPAELEMPRGTAKASSRYEPPIPDAEEYALSDFDHEEGYRRSSKHGRWI
ncbi:hypothetical protein QFC19_005801 [Naganishia cerealis]|uniref:Uncharacterized protein n=1 Tax=Naganishia cerealis TaxID=610337 RepID=A0ACC2VKP1_9TREE|nr:hypothetical protein QFC19_005801 [Naganishia cerealis]